jgi:type II secretory pathway pseudopilin PulG
MKNTHHTAGFTLVETLVAVSILVMAILGAFAAVRTGLSSVAGSKNQIVAFYLAEEAVEQIRNIRDQNGLNGLPWLTGIAANASDPCYFGKVCKVDSAFGSLLSACPGGVGSCPVLSLTDFDIYDYDPGQPATIYRREVTLSPVSTNPGDEVSVLVTITWTRGILNETFRVRENIMNWQ